MLIKVLRKFICNKENEDNGMRKERKRTYNDEENFSSKNPSMIHNEKNFIYKLQKNLGVSLDKFKIL